MDMQITFPGNQKIDAFYKGFTIHTDQPLPEGGDNSAPTPFDLFLSSIGTCAGVFVLRFLQQRHLDPTGLKIILRTEVNTQLKMLGKIALDIHLPPGFPDKYRDAVVKAADLCAVKKHILNPPQFEIHATISA